MSFAAWLAFLAGGATGAPSRYLLDGYIEGRTQGAYPWGTLAINVAGSALLGVLTGLALEHGLSATTKTTLGTGFCGAFTTFSTFTYETVRLAEGRAMRAALLNIAANTLLAAGAAGIALAITLR
jgi:fluoride exporter